MPIGPRRALDDRCACGHLRGERLMPEKGDTQYCLIQDCHCPKFELAAPAANKARAATKN
jgi:hypothetical protein